MCKTIKNAKAPTRPNFITRKHLLHTFLPRKFFKQLKVACIRIQLNKSVVGDMCKNAVFGPKLLPKKMMAF